MDEKIISVSKLGGLPGEGDVVNYSPIGKSLFYEGVVVSMEGDHSENWIGNFFDEHLGTKLEPFISGQGQACVFAGPYLYVILKRHPQSFRIIESYHPSDEWIKANHFSVGTLKMTVMGSHGGKLTVIDDAGGVIAEAGFDICEGMKFENVTDQLLKGKYYEFNLNQWIDFSFTLPYLQ